jgi:hypothetical protein
VVVVVRRRCPVNCAHGWKTLVEQLTDALWFGVWFVYGGLVACGACWCGAYGGLRVWEEWDRDWVRRREQRRIDREAARGVRAVEEYLQLQNPESTDGLDGAQTTSALKGHRRRRRQR